MRKTSILAIVASLALLTGCATPLGQQYGTVGAIGGAIIGGAVTGDVGGAAAGAAIGAVGGGLIGDQQTFENDRYYRGNPGYRNPPRYEDPRYYGGRSRPCPTVREDVYDRWGNYLGSRLRCR